MKATEKAQQIYGNEAVFKKCRGDKKFAYVVALARAVNALNSAHSLMMSTTDKNTPAAIRDRMNSYFFVLAILYETLKLIRRMSPVYRNDKSFQDSLQIVLKDKTARALEQMHLKAARRDAVFHYLPDRFAEAIAKTPMTECVFASILGQQKVSIHYTFADLIAAEIGAGARIDNGVVVNDMMEKTLNLVKQFIEYSENFIADQLNGWGFEVLPFLPGAPENPSAREGTMTQASQIVYQYDGNQNDRETEPNLDGDIPIPKRGDIVTRRGKRWKVVSVNTQLSGGAIPVHIIFLSSSLG